MSFQHRPVAIYEVDEQGATRPWVGQGSLVSPQVVLVHPPHSVHLAADSSLRRFRVGIADPTVVISPHHQGTEGFADVIEVRGEPQVLWSDESTDQVLVALDLSAPAHTPVYEVPGVAAEDSSEEAFRKTAEHLQTLPEADPISSPSLPPRNGHHAEVPQFANGWWCRMFPRGCKSK